MNGDPQSNRPGRIVLLNGVGSVGKTSIAKCLQSITVDPYLHVQMDAFMEMLPDNYQNHPDGFFYQTGDSQGNPIVVVTTGAIGERVLRGMRHAIVAMALQGNNLIVDDVLLGNEKKEYAQLLSDLEAYFVGLFAPLEILEAREQARGDRLIGLARWEYEKVHEGMRYDLEIDTSSATPLECARLISKKFQL